MPDIDVRAITWPVTPVIPPTVVTNQRITSGQTNAEVKCLADLWTDLQAVGAIAIADPTSVKGDILARSATALARLAVGTANQVLTVDAASPVGIKWATIDSTSVGAVPITRRVIAGGGLQGGGALSADVTLTADVRTVQGRTGAVVITAADVGAVPTARQVIAGAGMGGGGALTADVTLTANVKTVFGRTGDVVLTSGDITAAGGVPSSRTITAGTGLQGGGDLTLDRTLSVVDDTTNQKVRVSFGTVLKGTQREINFIQGANVVLDVTDDPANKRVNVTINSTGGSGGGSQTPWLSDIDAVGHNLSNLGVTYFRSLPWTTQPLQQRIYTDATGNLLFDASTNGTAWANRFKVSNAGGVTISGTNVAGADRYTAIFIDRAYDTIGDSADISWGTTGRLSMNAIGGGESGFIFYAQTGAGDGTNNEVMRIQGNGRVGIGTDTPRAKLSITSSNPGAPANATRMQLSIGESTNNPDYRFEAGYANDGADWKGVVQSYSGGFGGMLLLNPAGGKVGIGTTAPAEVLHVAGAAIALHSQVGNSYYYRFVCSADMTTMAMGYWGSAGAAWYGGTANLTLAFGGDVTVHKTLWADNISSTGTVTLNYHAQVNGNLNVGGAVTGATNLIKSGTNPSIGDWNIASSVLAPHYSEAGLCIHATAGANAFSGSPRIGFLWGSVASQLAMDAGGTITCLAWDASAYVGFRCSALYAAAIDVSGGNVQVGSLNSLGLNYGATPGPFKILATDGSAHFYTGHINHNTPEDGGTAAQVAIYWPSDMFIRKLNMFSFANQVFAQSCSGNLSVQHSGLAGISMGTSLVTAGAYGGLYWNDADASMNIYHSSKGHIITIKNDGNIYFPALTGAAGAANSGRLYRAGNALQIS